MATLAMEHSPKRRRVSLDSVDAMMALRLTGHRFTFPSVEALIRNDLTTVFRSRRADQAGLEEWHRSCDEKSPPHP